MERVTGPHLRYASSAQSERFDLDAALLYFVSNAWTAHSALDHGGDDHRSCHDLLAVPAAAEMRRTLLPTSAKAHLLFVFFVGLKPHASTIVTLVM